MADEILENNYQENSQTPDEAQNLDSVSESDTVSFEESVTDNVETDMDEEIAEKAEESIEAEKTETEINETKTSDEDQSERKVYDKKKFFYTKKVCKFCTRQLDENSINYKNVDLLKRFLMPSGKIVPRRINGCCARHQRMLAAEIKKARILAFIPFLDR